MTYVTCTKYITVRTTPEGSTVPYIGRKRGQGTEKLIFDIIRTNNLNFRKSTIN